MRPSRRTAKKKEEKTANKKEEIEDDDDDDDDTRDETNLRPEYENPGSELVHKNDFKFISPRLYFKKSINQPSLVLFFTYGCGHCIEYRREGGQYDKLLRVLQSTPETASVANYRASLDDDTEDDDDASRTSASSSSSYSSSYKPPPEALTDWVNMDKNRGKDLLYVPVLALFMNGYTVEYESRCNEIPVVLNWIKQHLAKHATATSSSSSSSSSSPDTKLKKKTCKLHLERKQWKVGVPRHVHNVAKNQSSQPLNFVSLHLIYLRLLLLISVTRVKAAAAAVLVQIMIPIPIMITIERTNILRNVTLRANPKTNYSRQQEMLKHSPWTILVFLCG